MSAEFDFNQFCRTLVREAPDAVIFADRDGVIRFWNAGAERIFGFKESEATGRSLDIIIPEDLRARHWSGFHETMRTGMTRSGEPSRRTPWRIARSQSRGSSSAPRPPTVRFGAARRPSAKLSIITEPPRFAP